MNLKPLGGKVIIKGTSEEEVTKSGIVIPDTVDKEKPEQGEVIAVGPGKVLDNGQRAEVDVKAGDKILFKKYGPDEVKFEDEDYLVLDQDDILAVIG